MKKYLSIILVVITVVTMFAGCSSKKDDKSDYQIDNKSAQTQDTTESTTKAKADLVISSATTYVTYINDIYNNPKNYIGRKVTIDGMYTSESYDKNTYRYVYRVGPGCCGNDGAMCGLEFSTENDEYPDYTPKETDTNDDHPWIKVTGTLDQYYEGDTGPYYTLKDATLQICDYRGVDTVTN